MHIEDFEIHIIHIIIKRCEFHKKYLNVVSVHISYHFFMFKFESNMSNMSNHE